jgi:DNA-binding response OmpR family regulator/predicted  nucleic acid-binding Zn-ribbon protein
VFSALIIDADGKTPATLKSILAPYGFEFTVTENGPEAVNVARQAAPDIILLRAELPLTTGFSVCNRLRRNEDTRKIPLVLYSSNASDDVIDQHRNLKTHADQYLRLPVDAERLIAAVRPYLNLDAPRAAPTSPAAPTAPAGPTTTPASRPTSRPEARARGRLDVELSEASGSRPPPPAPMQQFEREFGDEFGNLTGELRDDDDHTVAVRRSAERPRSGAVVSEGSGASRISGPEIAATDGESSGAGFKAQREVLQLKSQLNAKNREILSLKDELELRERAVLDAKKHHRELQAQLGELETQLVGSQELILSSRETSEAATRDKQTILKREEGLKSRLEVTLKKLKETENQLAGVQQLLATTQQHANAAATDARQRSAVQASQIADLEQERDGLSARVQVLGDQITGLNEDLENTRDQVTRLTHQLAQAQQDLEEGLAAAREERGNAIALLGTQHQAEIDEREQEHRITVDGLQKELAEALQTAQVERERMAQLLAETEENARLQIAQLTQTLAATEDSARTEIQRLTQNLAAAEAHARAEIERLQQDATLAAEQAQADAAEAAARIRELLATQDELSQNLDRAEAALHRRREAALHAQQALAVALRVLDSGDSEAT